MIGLVGQDQITTFTSPVNGTSPIDANVVRGNDNTVKTAFNVHDADPTVHLQSSLSTARPPAGVAGRKWLDTDTMRLWYDDGAAWHELAYIGTGGGTISGDVHLTGSLTVDGPVTANNAIQLALGQQVQWGGSTDAITVNPAGSMALYTGNAVRLRLATNGVFMPFCPVVIGADPGGTACLRVGGGALFNGVVSIARAGLALLTIDNTDLASVAATQFNRGGVAKGFVGADNGTLVVGAAANDIIVRAEAGSAIRFAVNGGNAPVLTLTSGGVTQIVNSLRVGSGSLAGGTVFVQAADGQGYLLFVNQAGNSKWGFYGDGGGNLSLLNIGLGTNAFGVSSANNAVSFGGVVVVGADTGSSALLRVGGLIQCSGGASIGGPDNSVNLRVYGIGTSDRLRVLNSLAGQGVALQIMDSAETTLRPMVIQASIVNLLGGGFQVPFAQQVQWGGSTDAIYVPATGTMNFYVANAMKLQITTSGIVLPGMGAGSAAVSVGAADSGGAGFRLLRVPN